LPITLWHSRCKVPVVALLIILIAALALTIACLQLFRTITKRKSRRRPERSASADESLTLAILERYPERARGRNRAA